MTDRTESRSGGYEFVKLVAENPEVTHADVVGHLRSAGDVADDPVDELVAGVGGNENATILASESSNKSRNGHSEPLECGQPANNTDFTQNVNSINVDSTITDDEAEALVADLERTPEHLLARELAKAGIPVLPNLIWPEKWVHTSEFSFKRRDSRLPEGAEPTTDLALIDKWWGEDWTASRIRVAALRQIAEQPRKNIIDFDAGMAAEEKIADEPEEIIAEVFIKLLKLEVNHGATLPHRIPETLSLGNNYIFLCPCEEFALEGELAPGCSLSYRTKIQITPNDNPVVRPIAEAPEWFLDAWWGEEFRGTPFDTPEAVSKAKRYLDRCGQEKDKPHSDEYVASMARQLQREGRSEQQIREKIEGLRNYEPEYLTTYEAAGALLDLGLSQARSTRLMLLWNQKNKPPLPAATVREQISEAWEIAISEWCMDRSQRWRYRNRPAEPGSLDDLFDGAIEEQVWLLGQIQATTTRTMLYGPTGKGKTMVLLAMAMRIAAGMSFLHWRAPERPMRVLYVDGDMPYGEMQRRVRAEIKRMGASKAQLTGFQLMHHEKVKTPKLDTDEGQRAVDAYIEDHGGFDLVVFDNIQALVTDGVEAWARVLDWTKDLTASGIGQLWAHHTGHDESHAYGTSTRLWGLDTTIHLRTHKAEQGNLVVSLAFEKSRLRTLDNHADYETVQVQLIDDAWSGSAGTNASSASRVALYEGVLEEATIEPDGLSTADFAALLAAEPDERDLWRKRLHEALKSRPYRHLWRQVDVNGKPEKRWFKPNREESA